ncbi:beta-N-acetylhexosaminidase, partial [Streptomyces daliensis]|nr:beta-N-acetylhexosaminidase [Streptomyces daliensis]
MRRLRPLLLCLTLLAAALPGSAAVAVASPSVGAGADGPPRPLDQVIPAPESVREGGAPFTLGERTPIRVTGGSGGSGGSGGEAREAREAARALAA